MTEERGNRKIDSFQAVLLLFALGGDVLAFYELRSLAQLMRKHVAGFPALDDDMLRQTLESRENFTTSTGNYFSCVDVDLCRLAMEFLAEPSHTGVVAHISAVLPFQGTDGSTNPARLSRDVRNSLFAMDSKLHRKSLELLNIKLPDDFAVGKPYWCLAEGDYTDWMAQLPVDLLSVCIRQLVPYMVHHLKPITALLDMALPRFSKLMGFAQFPLIDALIAVGRFTEAEELLHGMLNADANTLATRLAWLEFIRGDNAAAISMYSDALDNIQRPNYGNDFFFPTITGVFFIFALIRENTPASIGMACVETRIGLANPLFGGTYRPLNGYVEHVLRGTPVPEPICQELTLDTLAECLVQFWLHESGQDDPMYQRLVALEKKAQDAGFEWLAAECAELKCRQNDNWVPEDSTDRRVPVVPLVECVEILPTWTQDLNKVTASLDEFWMMKPMRASWQLSFSPDCPTNIVLDLFEQHLTKTDKWSKGHHIYLDKLARDVRATGWPPYFTAQDIRVVTLLMAMEDLDAGTAAQNIPDAAALSRERRYQVTHNDVLLNLLDYPRLFWADDVDQEPVKVVLDEPYVQIARDGEREIVLSILPNVDDQSHLAAVRYDDNTLHLFCFRQIHRTLRDALGRGVRIPERAVEHINDTCLKLAKLMRVKSDFNLDGLKIPETILMQPRAVMRLERKVNGLNVELMMQPWDDQEALIRPGEGAQAILECRDGRLVRKLRHNAGEEQLVLKILDGCAALTAAVMEGPYCWTIENGEGVFQFMMQLRSMLDVCKVLWKQDKKISLSRKISFGDVNMRAQSSNNWLEVDGDIVIDENLTLSFQKLLELSKEQKGTFITLDDGQVISLADEFRQCLDNFNNFGQVSKKGRLQFNQLSLPILQMMLDSFKNLEMSKEWSTQLARIDEAKTLDVPMPANLSAGTVLRDYQQEGVRWLTRLDHWGAGACLADDMGLGKTLQAIAFMLSKAHEGPSLVVAPTSVCANWVEELAKFAPSLKTVVFGQGDREGMLRDMKPGMVMISSYGLLQSQIQCFEKAEWRVVVLDEAQAIKNYQAKRSQAALQLNAKFRIATTGTPIENNLSELWTLFQFIAPGLFGSRQTFQDKFTTPVERDKNDEALQRLNLLIRPFLLRRKKDEVLKELPPKTEVQLHVDLSEEERAFYEAVRLNLLRELDEKQTDNQEQQRIRILAAIMKLRQAACNPLLIEPGTKVQSTKLEEFKNLIHTLVAGGHKTLVFSQFVKHLDIIRPCLAAMNITYEYLDGSTPTRDREEAVRNFQAGKSDLFLISLRAGGLGLNLTRADYVIILDPWWNPAVEDQAADRAHRLGQERPVTIYRIIARDTIEDKIIELHKHKQDLAVQLLGDANTAVTISSEELLKLLQESHD